MNLAPTKDLAQLSEAMELAADARGIPMERLRRDLVLCLAKEPMAFLGLDGPSTSDPARRLAANEDWLHRVLEAKGYRYTPILADQASETTWFPVVNNQVFTPEQSLVPSRVLEQMEHVAVATIGLMPGLKYACVELGLVGEDRAEVAVVSVDVSFSVWARQSDPEAVAEVAKAVLEFELSQVQSLSSCHRCES